MTTHVALVGTNKTKIVWIETELFFYPAGADAPRVYVRAWTLCCFPHRLSNTTDSKVTVFGNSKFTIFGNITVVAIFGNTQTFRRALTA